MKNITAAILGLSLVGIMTEAAAPVPGGQTTFPPVPAENRGIPRPRELPMTAAEAMQFLMNNGNFLARAYSGGVPDPIRVRRVDNRARMRALIHAKLNNMVVPKIDALNDYTMEEAIEALENIFKKADPAGEGFRMFINQYVDPGGVPLQNGGGGGAGGGGTGPGGGGQNVDPTTGLPVGLGVGGGGGQQNIDPTTGLPISGAPGTGAPGVGVPGVGGGFPGGGAPGVGGGLPGVGGAGLPGLPGMPGLPGLGGGAVGGGGAAPQGAFDPTTVKVRGLKKEMTNLTAKQILDVVCMSFDTPIQYIVTDQGLMFLQQKAELWGTVTRTYQLNLNRRTLQMMGVATPALTAPPTGGQGNGQGSGPGGGQGGGFGGGPDGGGGYPGGGAGGVGMGGGAGMGNPGAAPPSPQFYTPNNTRGFGSGYRPFNINRFSPAGGGSQRFNRFTPGYAPTQTRQRR